MIQDSLEEFEQFGTVALIGLLLVPGVAWILRGKSGGSVVARSLVVGAIVAGAVVAETAMDRTANSLTDGKVGV